MKTPFVTREQLESLTQEFPTPFHLYDEAGIRETARALHQAFAWNEGFKEYFAIKATPNPSILKILQEEGCGVDTASYVELLRKLQNHGVKRWPKGDFFIEKC